MEYLYKNTPSSKQTIQCLPEFVGDIFEQEQKHPFDILNELYPEGWSTGVTSLVLADLQAKYPSFNRNLSEHQYINSYESPERYSIGGAALFTYISTDKYLELTGRVTAPKEQGLDEYFTLPVVNHILKFSPFSGGFEDFYWELYKLIHSKYEYLGEGKGPITSYVKRNPEVEDEKSEPCIDEIKLRDWTGTKWQHSTDTDINGEVVFRDSATGRYIVHYITDREFTVTQLEIDHFFNSGTWIEVKEELSVRNWVGAQFCKELGGQIFTIEESTWSGKDYYVYQNYIVGGSHHTQEQVDYLFNTGTWMEIAESPISELDLLKSRLDNLEDLYYNTIDTRLAEVQELLKPKEGVTTKTKFHKGDVVESDGLECVVAVTEDSVGDYFSGIIIHRADTYLHNIGYISLTWHVDRFKKVNIKTT